MSITKIKQAVARIDDVAELHAVARYVRERTELICKRRREAAAAAAWERARGWKRGDTVYCCAAGTFLGGDIQRGTAMTVHSLQPRKNILWVTLPGGGTHWFAPQGIDRYNLQTTTPADPLSAAAAAQAKAAGEILSEAGL